MLLRLAGSRLPRHAPHSGASGRSANATKATVSLRCWASTLVRAHRGSRPAMTDLRRKIVETKSFREADRLLLVELEKSGGWDQLDPHAILELAAKAPSASDLHAKSETLLQALERAPTIDGLVLSRLFSNPVWKLTESHHLLVSLVHLLALRLGRGDPESPYLPAKSFQNILGALKSVSAYQRTLGDPKNNRTFKLASHAQDLLVEYIKNVRHDVPDLIVQSARSLHDLVEVQDFLKVKPVARSLDVMETLREALRSGPSTPDHFLRDQHIRDVCNVAIKKGLLPDLIDLTLATLQSSTYLGLLPPLAMALAESHDFKTLFALLKRLPADITFDPCLLILVTQLSHHVQLPELSEICVAVFYRAWETILTTDANQKDTRIFSLIPSALERMLVIALRSSNTHLALATIRAARKLHMTLNPRSINNVLFLFLDHGLTAHVIGILEVACGISKPTQGDDRDDVYEDAVASVSLFQLDSQLSPVNMKVYSHIIISITCSGVWEFAPRFIEIIRRLRVSLSDSFCKAAFADARVSGAGPIDRLVLAQLFVDCHDVFNLSPLTLKLLIEEASATGRPDKCLEFTQTLFHRFGVDYADAALLRTVLKSFAKSGDDQTALKVLLLFKEHGVKVDSSLYTVLLRMYEQQGDVASYFRMIEGMMAAQIEVPPSALVRGAELCIRERSPVLVRALLMLDQNNIPSKMWRWRAAKEILKDVSSIPEKSRLLTIVSDKLRGYETSAESSDIVNM